MNENCMFQVDNILFKIFENGHVTCSIEYFDELLNMSENDFFNLNKDNKKFTIYNSTNNLKGNYGTSVERYAINGNGKEKVRVDLYYGESMRRLVDNRVHINGVFVIDTRGFRKFSGIWWPTKRTITNNVNASIFVHNHIETASDVGTVFDNKRVVLLKNINLVLYPTENPIIYINSVSGYVKIPAVTCYLDLQ